MILPTVHFRFEKERLIAVSPQASQLVTRMLGAYTIPGCMGIDTETDPLELTFANAETAFWVRMTLDSIAAMPESQIDTELASSFPPALPLS